MKKCIIVVSAVLGLMSCKQKTKEVIQENGVIVLRALNSSDSNQLFSTLDTVKVIQVLILQDQIVKQSYFMKDENIDTLMRILAENELAYKNVYNEEWLETIKRPRGTKSKKKKRKGLNSISQDVHLFGERF